MDLKEIFKKYIDGIASKSEKRLLQTICNGIGVTIEQAAILYLLMNQLTTTVTDIEEEDIDLSVFDKTKFDRPYQEI